MLPIEELDLFSDKKDSTKEEPPSQKVPTPKRGSSKTDYTAADIEVLEGLEPVRRRPGMYIGGTDTKALHHLFAEVIDNSMDEAVAGHAKYIEVELYENGNLRVSDNGRGIPVDPHPKFKNKSALEVIMTTLHAGGKFGSDVYDTSGGLHGVGISVVNALSDSLTVEVIRDKQLYRQKFSRGIPEGKITKDAPGTRKRGTTITFHPDTEIFGDNIKFDPQRLYNMAKAKAYLFGGIKIIWHCAPALIKDLATCPAEDQLFFPEGLKEYLKDHIANRPTVTPMPFAGKIQKDSSHGSVEWAIHWIGGADNHIVSYCNTVPTPDGGTHEQGMKQALTKGLKAYGELISHKHVNLITAEDVIRNSSALISIFFREPEFQGQTKDRLASPEATKIVEKTLKDAFEIWLVENKNHALKLLEWVIDSAQDRLRRKQERDVNRKSAIRKLRLPGKLADCSQNGAKGSELFIVEGDSAGGSAKQGRNRKTQAILPLRGKILNVANCTDSKKQQSQLISDLIQALGCGIKDHYQEDELRYEKIIIMTDADVDGAHIAALLITFFHEEMTDLIKNKHLYIAVPPLYRLAQGGKTFYARDDKHKDEIIESEFHKRSKYEISRFKGLGEMLPAQLKETTMNPKNRTLLQVEIPSSEAEDIAIYVKDIMGNKAEKRLQFIQENAEFSQSILDI